jgi:hypothetical protein
MERRRPVWAGSARPATRALRSFFPAVVRDPVELRTLGATRSSLALATRPLVLVQVGRLVRPK